MRKKGVISAPKARYHKVGLQAVSSAFRSLASTCKQHRVLSVIGITLIIIGIAVVTVYVWSINKAQPTRNPAVAEYERQLPELKKAAGNKTSDADAQSNYAAALYASGSIAEAKDQYAKALALSPENATFHNNYANTLRDLGSTDEAVRAYREAIRLNPKLLNAYSNLANIQLYTQNNAEAAISTYVAGLEANPNESQLEILLGSAYERAKETEQARQTYQHILTYDPENRAALTALARIQ